MDSNKFNLPNHKGMLNLKSGMDLIEYFYSQSKGFNQKMGVKTSLCTVSEPVSIGIFRIVMTSKWSILRPISKKLTMIIISFLITK